MARGEQLPQVLSAAMTEKICPECNGEGVVDQGTEDERRDLELSPMTDKTPKRYGIHSQIEDG
jgi:hypothetical protein